MAKWAGIGVGDFGCAPRRSHHHYDRASLYHHYKFEVEVCTSTYAPADTAIDPALPASPALLSKLLRPLVCADGWLGFTVPRGHKVAKLEYDYRGTISWDRGTISWDVG